MNQSNLQNALKKELGGIKRLPITLILSIVFFVASFATVIYYICGPSVGFWHSDCTDSLYWANATIESGMIIADNYRYAAILPFSANLWMIPIIKLFGFSVKSQIISMVIFAVLYALSQIWVLRSLRLTWPLTLTATGVMLMVLSSSTKMREIMWEHVIYYSLAILVFNCLLALFLNIVHTWEKYRQTKSTLHLIATVVLTALLCALSLGTSTNGFSIIIMTTAPVFIGVAAEMLFESKKALLSSDNTVRIFSAGCIPVFTVVGLKVLDILKGDIVADYTNFYSRFAPIKNWPDNLFKFPSHFLTLIGFTDDTAELAAKEGISNLITLCIFIVLTVAPIIALLFYNKFKHRETRIALLSYLALFGMIMLVFICGNIANVNWRITPIVGISMIPLFAIVNELFEYHRDSRADETKKNSSSTVPFRLAVVIVMLFTVFSYKNYKEITAFPADFGRDNTVHQLTNVLKENGLEYGFATFWRSQAITLLSDNTVKCREILATPQAGAKTDYYQSSYDWYAPQEGVEQYFVLLSDDEYSKVRNHPNWISWTENQLVRTIEYNYFHIFVFDGYIEGIQ